MGQASSRGILFRTMVAIINKGVVMMYLVKSNLKHDGKRYKAGASVELNDKQAKPLLDGGVVEDLSKKSEAKIEQPQEEVSKGKGKK